MKSNFKKIGLFLVIGLAVAVFYSCDKDKDDFDDDNNGSNVSEIIATNVINGSAQITTVKALVYWENSDDDYGNDAIAQTQYINNGFTLKLPSTLAAKYLDLLSEDAPQGVSISDKDAKALFLENIEGYDKDENGIGYFYFEEESDDSEYYNGTSWVFADRDVTIKGEDKEISDYYDYEYVIKFDLKLKKGWNIAYVNYTESYNSSTKRDVSTYLFTSQKPSGVNYSWNFDLNYTSRSAQVTTRSVESTKNVFSKLKENKNRARKQ